MRKRLPEAVIIISALLLIAFAVMIFNRQSNQLQTKIISIKNDHSVNK
ncbi:MAG: hypothetical protein K2X48_13855 [Chitinophagaceae bacterium]|nr:hypothetical protein [Chitinophagaceae bacterium]